MQNDDNTVHIDDVQNPDAIEYQDELFVRFECVVDKGQTSERVDKYLAEHIPGTSRSRIQAAADQQQILVNSRVVSSSYKVKPGETIQVLLNHEPHDFTIHPEPIPLDIVYEDDDLLVPANGR